MNLPWEILHHLPVRTESGQKMGVIEGVAIDAITHGITHYEIRPPSFLAGLLGKALLVEISQVVSLDNEKMIVKDSVAAVISESGNKKTRLASAQTEMRTAEMND